MTKFTKFLSKTWFRIKTFFKGLATTLTAAIGLANVPVAFRMIKEINTTTGWSVIWSFLLLLLYFVVFILITYFIGTLVNDSNELYEYKCKCKEHNNDSGTIYVDPAVVHRSDSNKKKTSGKK
jgi:hypothetical protein